MHLLETYRRVSNDKVCIYTVYTQSAENTARRCNAGNFIPTSLTH